MKNILVAIQKFESNVADGLLNLPYETSFSKLITLYGCKSRTELILQIAEQMIGRYDHSKGIEIQNIQEIFPGIEKLPLTQTESTEIQAYLHYYFGLFMVQYISDINKLMVDLSGNLRRLVQVMDNNSRSLSTLGISVNGIIDLNKEINKVKPTNIRKTPGTYYYWKHSEQKLEELEQSLIQAGLIEHNPHFKRTFKSEKLLSGLYLTRWNGTRPQAYYMLYKIFNAVSYNKEDIGEIADNLFVFDGANSAEVSRASFSKFHKRLNKENFDKYASKKLADITLILDIVFPAYQSIPAPIFN